jgi:hypothetical protein
MNTWFLDDSRQSTPSRDGMETPLCSVGGICVPEAHLQHLASSLEDLCSRVGFPTGEEFKWSPGRELWMRANLQADERTSFFLEAARLAKDHSVTGILVCSDVKYEALTNADTHELATVRLLLERIHQHTPRQQQCTVIADTPSGSSRRTNDDFIYDCLNTVRSGTNVFASLDRIHIVLLYDSRWHRCLQLADLFTSCLTAYIAGEDRWSPPVAESLRELLREEMGRRGGYGVKLHPDYIYSNLYHWLFGDEYFVTDNLGDKLPMPKRPYGTSPDRFGG